MKQKYKIHNKKELIEKLAELEHIQWAHWTQYMLSNLTDDKINLWKYEIKTEYKDLTEKQKDSDRIWARKVFNILKYL